MRLVIISGRSGSGKSTALHVLEDVGFNCIDNLPASLLPNLVEEIMRQPEQEEQRFAISIDARNAWQNLEQFPQLVRQAQLPESQCEVIFLDARSNVLIKRFSETRRKHPLSDENTALIDAIARERQLLEPIVDVANLVIDTSNLNLHELRDLVKKRVIGGSGPDMAILFQSFGFKHGVPVDADLVFDVRCLPNPYWKANLRAQTGRDQGVIDFLTQQPESEEMFADIRDYLRRWLPRFEASNRSYITIAIGCTGGQHRSVYLSDKLQQHFEKQHPNVQVRHRELGQSS